MNKKIVNVKEKDCFTFIDLFAGIGGFRIGCEMNGGRCVFSSEIDKYAVDVYENNFGDRPSGDITKITIKDIPDFDVLCAGFPCQAFSMSGSRKGFDDVRGTLIFDVMRVIDVKRPRAFFLENVPGLLSHDGGRTFMVIRNMLGNIVNGRRRLSTYEDNLGYNMFYKILNSADFGLAQNRKRIFIVGFRDDVVGWRNFRFPKATNRNAIIKDIVENDVDSSYYLTDDEIRKLLEKSNRACLVDRLVHTDKKADTIIGSCGAVGSFGSIYVNVKEKSNTIMTNIWRRDRADYGNLSRYLFVNNEKCGMFDGIGKFDIKQLSGNIRLLTQRECARLQGFPEDFRICDDARQAYRQFGNAVSPPVIAEIVRKIMEVL